MGWAAVIHRPYTAGLYLNIPSIRVGCLHSRCLALSPGPSLLWPLVMSPPPGSLPSCPSRPHFSILPSPIFLRVIPDHRWLVCPCYLLQMGSSRTEPCSWSPGIPRVPGMLGRGGGNDSSGRRRDSHGDGEHMEEQKGRERPRKER